MSTVTIPSGTTLRDYCKIGFGNTDCSKRRWYLRWDTGTIDNLLVGDANSTANLELATGATFTITGALGDKIASYVLNGTATVQQQNTNPFVVASK